MRPAPAPDDAPQSGRGVNPALPASVVPVAATAPQVASSVPSPKLSMDKALERTPVIIPAALPVRPTVRTAPIKPSALIPAAAKPPALPPGAAPTASGKLAPNAPLPSLNRPTDVASRPVAPSPTTKVIAAGMQHHPKPTDSLGLLVARLGVNR
jgi:hypothetical protein